VAGKKLATLTGDPGDGNVDPRKEFSFLVNGHAGPWIWINRSEMVLAPSTTAPPSAVGGDSRCPRKTQGSTPTRRLSVPRTAAGLLGEEPLVYGAM